MEFRDVVPRTEAVLLAGPESSTSGASGDVAPGGVEEPWAEGPWAKYYGLTRHVRDQVNEVTRSVLGGVWLIVHTQPTEVTAGQVVWGPFNESLDPVSYRLVVLKVAQDEYAYRWEGRPRTSAAESDFRTVLRGSGYGRGHPSRGQGWFEIDLDAARELDPQKNDASGTLLIEHDLPASAWREQRDLPRVIKATATPRDTEAFWAVTSEQTSEGGRLDLTALDDLDPAKQTLLEDIRIVSRWQRDGAGRADVELSQGDIPASVGAVTAVECWGTDFLRSYYADSIDFEPGEGDPASCVFDSAP